MPAKYSVLSKGTLFLVDNDGGLPPIADQNGGKFIFDPAKYALRAGASFASYNTSFDATADLSWSDLSRIGWGSAGFGINTEQKGDFAIGGGLNTKANGCFSFVLGKESIANGDFSFALGQDVEAGILKPEWDYATVGIGQDVKIYKHYAFGSGYQVKAGRNSDDHVGAHAWAVGYNTEVQADLSFGFGRNITITSKKDVNQSGAGIDYENNAPGYSTFAFGSDLAVETHQGTIFGAYNTLGYNSPHTAIFGQGVEVGNNNRGVLAVGEGLKVVSDVTSSQFSSLAGCGVEVHNSGFAFAHSSDHSKVRQSSFGFIHGVLNELISSDHSFAKGSGSTITSSVNTAVFGHNNNVTNSSEVSLHGLDNTAISTIGSIAFGTLNTINGGRYNLVQGLSNQAIDGTSYGVVFGASNKLDTSSVSLAHGYNVTVSGSAASFALGSTVNINNSSNSFVFGVLNNVTDSPKAFVSGTGVNVTNATHMWAGGDNVTVDFSNYTGAPGSNCGWGFVNGSEISVVDTAARPTTSPIAIGCGVTITGSVGAIGLGEEVSVEGHHSFGAGYDATIKGDGSVALGWSVSAYGDMAQAIGNNAHVGADGNEIVGLALGSSAIVQQQGGVAIGGNVQSNAENAIVLGVAEGSPLVNNKENSLLVGFENGSIKTLFAQNVSGVSRVGVNTDAPISDFHVAGDMMTDTKLKVLGQGLAAGVAANYGEIYYDDAQSDLFFKDKNGTAHSLTATGGGGGGSSLWSENAGNIFRAGGNAGVGIDPTNAKFQVKTVDNLVTNKAVLVENTGSAAFEILNNGTVKVKGEANSDGAADADTLFGVYDASDNTVFHVSGSQTNTQLRTRNELRFTNALVVDVPGANLTLEAGIIPVFNGGVLGGAKLSSANGFDFNGVAHFNNDAHFNGDLSLTAGKAIKPAGSTGTLLETTAPVSPTRFGFFNAAGTEAIASIDANGYWITKVNQASFVGTTPPVLNNEELTLYMDGTALNGKYKDATGTEHDLTFGSQVDKNIATDDLTVQANRTLDLNAKTLDFLGGNDLDVKFSRNATEYAQFRYDSSIELDMVNSTTKGIRLSVDKASHVVNDQNFVISDNPAGPSAITSTAKLEVEKNAAGASSVEVFRATRSAGLDYMTTGFEGTVGTYINLFEDGNKEVAINTDKQSHFKNGLSINEADPKSTVHINGSVSLAHRPEAGVTTLDENDHIVYANAATTNVTINLPAANTAGGRVYHIKRTDDTLSGNSVTIQGNASETIDGQNTLQIVNQYDAYKIHCDGTQWFIL